MNNEHPETLSKIGVLGLETGELYSHPQRSEVSIEKQNLVLQNAVYNYAFKDAKTIFFTPEELPATVALTEKIWLRKMLKTLRKITCKKTAR